MKKISEMYRISGGTDYRHTCFECRNCLRKKQNRYKCRLYEEAGGNSDWKPSYIACKFFGADHLPERFRSNEWQQDMLPEDEGIQMTIADFPEWMPGSDKGGTKNE